MISAEITCKYGEVYHFAYDSYSFCYVMKELQNFIKKMNLSYIEDIIIRKDDELF